MIVPKSPWEIVAEIMDTYDVRFDDPLSRSVAIDTWTRQLTIAYERSRSNPERS